MDSDKTLYLIDGSACVYRAYHAIRGLTNSKGFPTNAVFGFTRILMKLIQERAPAYAAMFFDAKGPTFRHERYPAYKANRPPMPEDLAAQLPDIRAVTEGFQLPVIERAGYEADDLIGTVSRKAQDAGFFVVMVTGDKDFIQLVTARAVIWDPMKDTLTGLEDVRTTYGLEPQQMIDVMGFSGDPTDNVPGVPGIGPKTAVSLVQTFGSMSGLYERLDRVAQARQREKLAAFKDQAFLSRELVRIDTSAPVDFAPERFRFSPPDRPRLAALFGKLEFRRLQQEWTGPADLSAKDYRAVLDPEDLARLIERLGSAEVMAIDTETTSRNPHSARLVGVSFALEPNRAFYIPCGHRYPGSPPQLDCRTVLQRLKPVLENASLRKVGQNIKYDWTVLSRHGIELAGVAFDTMLASYLLNPAKRAHSLDQIALDFLGHKTTTFADAGGKAEDGLASVPLEQAVPYACEDADITLAAFRVLGPLLEADGLTHLLQTVELPLVPVLMAMERAGVGVDRQRLKALSRSFADQLEALERDIHALAGEAFNIHSSQQLGRILFEKLALPTLKKTRKKTAYSTDVDVLTELAATHELPALVLRHRSLAKLKSTYADALLDLVDPQTGRLHTQFNQTITATGRLSSSDPNLQNIPIRTAEGREIRRAFVAREGCKLLSADYSQIELRILAHCSGDRILMEAFHRGEDIHARTAAEVFGIPAAEVGEELRRQAKAINFGIIYGMSAFGLSRQLGISQKMAKTTIDNYFNRYQGVNAYIEETIAAARRHKRTSTLLGRIRPLPEIDSQDRGMRQFAERTAVNTPIQGSAADLIKLAMIQVDGALRGLKLRAAMLLSVHDELVFEVPVEESAASGPTFQDAGSAPLRRSGPAVSGPVPAKPQTQRAPWGRAPVGDRDPAGWTRSSVWRASAPPGPETSFERKRMLACLPQPGARLKSARSKGMANWEWGSAPSVCGVRKETERVREIRRKPRPSQMLFIGHPANQGVFFRGPQASGPPSGPAGRLRLVAPRLRPARTKIRRRRGKAPPGLVAVALLLVETAPGTLGAGQGPLGAYLRGGFSGVLKICRRLLLGAKRQFLPAPGAGLAA